MTSGTEPGDDTSKGEQNPGAPCPEPGLDLSGGGPSTVQAELARLRAPITAALDHQPIGLVQLEITPDDGVLHWDGVRQLIEGEHGPHDQTIELSPYRVVVIKAGLSAPALAEGYTRRIHDAIRSEHPCRVTIGLAVSRSGDTAEMLHKFALHAFEDARLLGGDTVVAFDDQDRDLIIR